MLAGLVMACVLVAWATMRAISRPPRRTYASAVARGVPGDPSELAQARTFTTWTFAGARGGRIESWDVPGDDPEGPIVVLTHGWGESRISGLVRVPALARVASRVVLWDMPGHGVTPGPSALGAREARDLGALLACLNGPAVLYGWSMGAGVSMEAAVLHPERVRAVVTETPYRVARTPAAAVLRARGLPAGVMLSAALGVIGSRRGAGLRWRRGVTGAFDRRDVAAKLACPLLVLGAERDEVSPCADAQAIAAAGRGELVIVPGATHNGLWREAQTRAVCGNAVCEWIRGLER